MGSGSGTGSFLKVVANNFDVLAGYPFSPSQHLRSAVVVAAALNGTTQTRGLTAEDLMLLLTGPLQRTAEELDRSKLGGGFRSYGYDRNRVEEGSNSRWGSSRVSDESRRQREGGFNRDSSKELAPSRADEVDDWGLRRGRRFENQRERRVGFESNGGADSENWVKKKEEEGRKF
ncbi:hypothetical protein ACSBR1_036823 [Camellia fascicularis]